MLRHTRVPLWKDQAVQPFCVSSCKRLACINGMYILTSNEINSFEQTHLLFLVHGIYVSFILGQYCNF